MGWSRALRIGVCRGTAVWFLAVAVLSGMTTAAAEPSTVPGISSGGGVPGRPVTIDGAGWSSGGSVYLAVDHGTPGQPPAPVDDAGRIHAVVPMPLASYYGTHTISACEFCDFATRAGLSATVSVSVAPTLAIEPGSATSGSLVTATGIGWFDGFGPVRILPTSDPTTQAVAEANPRPDGTLTVPVRLPVAEPGRLSRYAYQPGAKSAPGPTVVGAGVLIVGAPQPPITPSGPASAPSSVPSSVAVALPPVRAAPRHPLVPLGMAVVGLPLAGAAVLVVALGRRPRARRRALAGQQFSVRRAEWRAPQAAARETPHSPRHEIKLVATTPPASVDVQEELR